MAESLQKRLQSELDKYKSVQKDFQKYVMQRQQLDAQLTENNVVKEELNLLKPDATVYKMIGPVLVKQDLEEAKQTVSKRIEYITGEIKRVDTTTKELEKKQESHRDTLSKLQQQFQQAQVKAAMKS
ncbi:PREDICTED: prefoldin subunit 6-like [Priapulus caudatus]|uniref:Prefoldin subunit 6-like n=1 Tax=Priapulus caudatus TaxID=37621 RepID=A0ABM1EE65_PRICU|nr:PREDICTED: prefoldin subunit 6-like [Priapulus caudatus]